MAITRATVLSAMASYVQDDSGKITHTDPGDFGTAIDRAVAKYSQDRPRERYSTASGNGVAYEFAKPTGWVEEFSRLLRVEYPYPPATGQREPNTIFDINIPNAPASILVARDSAGASVIRFMDDVPVTGTNNIVFVISALHTLHASDSAQTTIRESDDTIIPILAASYACEMLSSKYTDIHDAALTVDTVDYRSKADEFAKRAKKLMDRYGEHMGFGKDGPDVPAAGGTVEWDVQLGNGRDRLLKRGRYR